MLKMKENISEHAKGVIIGNQSRAVLISDIVETCEKNGYDIDLVANSCFYKGGVDASRDAEGDNPDDFVRFMTAGNVEVFDKEVVQLDPELSVARFHYCPLVAKWEEMGLSQERITYLCDLAGRSDYGRASNFKNVDLSFPKRLSCGDPYCELVAKAKDKS